MTSLQIPTFAEPASPSVSPYAEQIEEYTRSFAEEVGLTLSAEGQRRLDAGYGRFVAWTYPAATFEDLCICAEWLFVTFSLDDLHTLPIYNSPEAWQPVHRRLLRIIETGNDSDEVPTPFTRAVADLSERTRRRTSATFYRRFTHHLDMFFQGFSRESKHRQHRILPELADFLEVRRLSVGMEFGFDLVELSQGFEIPEAIYTSSAHQNLVSAAADVVAWQNDVHSLQLDIRCGNIHNLVLVLQQETGADLERAVELACDRIRYRLNDFASAEHQLPYVLNELGVSTSDQIRILKLVGGMRQWANGCLEWYRTTTRYTVPASSAEADRHNLHLRDILSGHHANAS